MSSDSHSHVGNRAANPVRLKVALNTEPEVLEHEVGTTIEALRGDEENAKRDDSQPKDLGKTFGSGGTYFEELMGVEGD